MNYEEKYNEALKVIESLYNVVMYQSSSDALFASQTIEKAFPELRESEDEKIRKGIIKSIKDLSTDWIGLHGVTKEDAIAWLEKQGEQKPTPKYKIGDCIEYRGEKYKITNVTITDNNFYYDVSLIEEPSDWGEVVAAIGMAAEEKMFKIEQEPSWNEEDEKMKSLIISTLTSMGTLNLERYHHMNLDEVKNWLNSLKPNHWKPTEEQISELGKAAILQNVRFNQSILESLYNDLKSL